MASLSVDEKDWLQEQIRTACEFRLLPQRGKHGVNSGMLRKNMIWQNLTVTVQR
jgi:hypothetical protein